MGYNTCICFLHNLTVVTVTLWLTNRDAVCILLLERRVSGLGALIVTVNDTQTSHTLLRR